MKYVRNVYLFQKFLAQKSRQEHPEQDIRATS